MREDDNRGDYRSIYSTLLDNPGYRRLTPNARHVFQTLKISRLNNWLGIFIFEEGEEVTLKKQVGRTAQVIHSALLELQKEGWIEIESPLLWIINNVKFEPTMSLNNEKHVSNANSILIRLPNTPLLLKFCEHYDITYPFGTLPVATIYPIGSTKTDTDTKTETKTETDTLSGKPDGVPYQTIIDDLNSYQDSHYKPGTESIRKLIRARWAEGYRLEDFQYVHAVKFSNWQGEKIDGLPALRYFRPKTLYSASNFPGYREEKFNHEYIANQFGGQELQNLKHIAAWVKKKGGEDAGQPIRELWPHSKKPIARIPERSE